MSAPENRPVVIIRVYFEFGPGGGTRFVAECDELDLWSYGKRSPREVKERFLREAKEAGFSDDPRDYSFRRRIRSKTRRDRRSENGRR